MSKFRIVTAKNTPDRIVVEFYRKNSQFVFLKVSLYRASFYVKTGWKSQGEDEIVVELLEDNRKISKNIDKFSTVLEQLGFERDNTFYDFHRKLNPVKEKDFNNFIEVIMTLIEKLF